MMLSVKLLSVRKPFCLLMLGCMFTYLSVCVLGCWSIKITVCQISDCMLECMYVCDCWEYCLSLCLLECLSVCLCLLGQLSDLLVCVCVSGNVNSSIRLCLFGHLLYVCMSVSARMISVCVCVVSVFFIKIWQIPFFCCMCVLVVQFHNDKYINFVYTILLI